MSFPCDPASFLKQVDTPAMFLWMIFDKIEIDIGEDEEEGELYLIARNMNRPAMEGGRVDITSITQRQGLSFKPFLLVVCRDGLF